MTHIGDLMRPEPEGAGAYALPDWKLQPDDIVTHVCTGHSGGLLDENKKVMPEAWEAKSAAS